MSCPFQDHAGPHGAAAAYATGDRVLRVEGRGARGWLNSLLTADLGQEVADAARYALLLTPEGGIVSDAWAVDFGAKGLALVLPENRSERVFHLLGKYLLNEDVTFAFDDSVSVVTILGPRPRQLVEHLGEAPTYLCNRLGVGGVDVWVPASKAASLLASWSAAAHDLDGGGVLNARAWCAWRVTLGVPMAGVDFDDEASPHEVGLEARAVSLGKGCYVGKELVARQHRRGGLSRRLVQLEVEGSEAPSPGAIVRDPLEAEVGRITSAAPARDEQRSTLALAYVLPHFAEPGARLTSDRRSARVRRLVGQSERATVQGQVTTAGT